MSEELKLLPCPNCTNPPMQGGLSVLLVTLDRAWDNGGWWNRVICADCGKRGKVGALGEEAIKNWNDGIYEDVLPRALTWTTEPPKEPGWYFVLQQRPRGGKHVFPVWWDAMVGEPENVEKWAGPIPMPKEPQNA